MVSGLDLHACRVEINNLHVYLPSQIQVDQKGLIKYYYYASGNKLQKRTTDNSASPNKTAVTTYIGGAVCLNDTLQFFGTPDGRVRADDAKSKWIYDYFLKDHLGNTRMMITDDYNVSSPILEAYSYYPFGLQQRGIGLAASGNLHNYKNTFQKQEFNEDLGVDMYEFKYRMDDPQIGRFWQVDPLADEYTYNSPYAFSENKVTNGVELEGLEWAPAPYNAWDVSKSVGRIQFTPESQAMARKVANHFGLVVIGAATDNPELVEPIVVDVVTGIKILAGASSEVSATTNSNATKATVGEAPSRAKLLNAESTQGSGQGRGKNNRKPDKMRMEIIV